MPDSTARVSAGGPAAGAAPPHAAVRARAKPTNRLFLEQPVNNGGHGARIVFARDVGDRAVAVDDDVDGKRVGPSVVSGVADVVPGLLETDRVADPEAFGEPLHATDVICGRPAAHTTTASGIDANDDQALSFVLPEELLFDVWQLQTADRSKRCEVCEQRDVPLRLL